MQKKKNTVRTAEHVFINTYTYVYNQRPTCLRWTTFETSSTLGNSIFLCFIIVVLFSDRFDLFFVFPLSFVENMEGVLAISVSKRSASAELF